MLVTFPNPSKLEDSPSLPLVFTISSSITNMDLPNSTPVLFILWFINNNLIYWTHGATYLLKQFHYLLTFPLSFNLLVLRAQISQRKVPTYLSAYVYFVFQPSKSNCQSFYVPRTYSTFSVWYLCSHRFLTLECPSLQSQSLVQQTLLIFQGLVLRPLNIRIAFSFPSGTSLTKYPEMSLWSFQSVPVPVIMLIQQYWEKAGKTVEWRYFSKMPSQCHQLQLMSSFLLDTSWVLLDPAKERKSGSNS